MTGEQLATLLNVGSAGAVIAVVLIFLNFIKERDKETRDFFSSLRNADGEKDKKINDLLDKMVSRLESLENKFDAHDATEMEFLRGVVAQLDRRSTTRKPNDSSRGTA